MRIFVPTFARAFACRHDTGLDGEADGLPRLHWEDTPTHAGTDLIGKILTLLMLLLGHVIIEMPK